MALSGKYGKINVQGIGENEPVFILRAQDKLAETAIEIYRLLALSHGLPLGDALIKEVERFRQGFVNGRAIRSCPIKIN